MNDISRSISFFDILSHNYTYSVYVSSYLKKNKKDKIKKGLIWSVICNIADVYIIHRLPFWPYRRYFCFSGFLTSGIIFRTCYSHLLLLDYSYSPFCNWLSCILRKFQHFDGCNNLVSFYISCYWTVVCSEFKPGICYLIRSCTYRPVIVFLQHFDIRALWRVFIEHTVDWFICHWIT